MCPRQIFITHLLKLITDSIILNFQIKLEICANEHMVEGKLEKELCALGLVEACFSKFQTTIPASHCCGQNQIHEV